jgi:hypothetical protein
MILVFFAVLSALITAHAAEVHLPGSYHAHQPLIDPDESYPFDKNPEESKKRRVLQRLSNSKTPPPLASSSGGAYHGKLTSGSLGATRSSSISSSDASDNQDPSKKLIIIAEEGDLEKIQETSQLTPVAQGGHSPAEEIDERHQLK